MDGVEMKYACALALLIAGITLVFGQEDEMTLDDMIESGRQWLSENLDESVLESLGE